MRLRLTFHGFSHDKEKEWRVSGSKRWSNVTKLNTSLWLDVLSCCRNHISSCLCLGWHLTVYVAVGLISYSLKPLFNIWLLSAVGKNTIGIHSRVEWLAVPIGSGNRVNVPISSSIFLQSRLWPSTFASTKYWHPLHLWGISVEITMNVCVSIEKVRTMCNNSFLVVQNSWQTMRFLARSGHQTWLTRGRNNPLLAIGKESVAFFTCVYLCLKTLLILV